MINTEKQPLVSIALCTYNGEKHLVEQLDSLVNQTYNNLEIIVVDDCSEDSTLNILKQYKAEYPFFKVYQNRQNLGYIKNFEKAISLCNGDFIALSDQDDIWDSQKIALLTKSINHNILIYHDSEFIDEKEQSLGMSMSDILNMYHGNSYKPFLFFNCISGHAIFFKRELINYCLPFPKEIFHDRWMAFVATNIGSIGYISKKLVHYRQHERSDTNILKLKRANIKPATTGKNKIITIIKELEIFCKYPNIKDKKFISKLHKYYERRLKLYLCIKLVIFIFSHYKSLLYISKKDALSKFNFIFKHIWGGRLKKF